MKRKSLLIMLLAALFMPLALHAQQSLPYSCGFESGDDLSGWLIQGGPENAGIYSAYPHEGERHWGFNYEDPDCYLVSPIFTGGDNGIVVSFYYESYSASYPDCFKVGYTTDESITDASQFTYDETICEETGAWTQYNQTFPAGTKRIAVMYLNNNGNGWYLWLDDFEFTVPGAAVCNRPTGLTATNVGSRTATISWTSDASAWQICVNDDEAHLINVNQTSYTLSGLTPDTEYTVKVRTNCGNNNFSAWTNVSFTTEVACPAPEVTIADITSTSANITWTGSANSYNLRYRNLTFFDDFESGELTNWTIYTEGEVGEGLEGWRIIDPTGGLSWTGHNGSTYVASAWSWSSSAYNANNWLITPQVQLGGVLKFYVYTNQNYPDEYEVLLSTSGNAIDNFTVTLQAMASVPTTGDWVEVSIDLNAYAGQTGYIALHHQYYDGNYILVDDFGIFNRTWTTANGVTSPYAISGLTPETSYEVEVQAVCGGQDGSSEWAQTTFTTLPSCVAPARLTITDITTNSAVVTWTGSANSYNLKVNDQTYNNVTSPYTLSGLTPNTEYTVEVQSVCSASSTSTWSTSVFWTACEAFNLPYSYNFDNDNELNCWSLISANNNMLGITTVDNNNVFIFSSYNSASSYDQYLISPELNGTAGVGIDVEFKYRSYNGNGSGETFKVGYSTTTNDISSFTWGDEISTLSTDWIDYFGEFPAGTKYVAVYYYADYQYYFLVDDFNFDVHSNCRKPTNLQATEITANSVTLSWTENGEATAWVVSYSSGVRPTTVNVTETTVTIPVSSETYYTARVRPVCDVNDKWSDEISFTTPSTCPLPSDITVDEGSTSATLSWSELTDVDSYNVRYCIFNHGAALLEEGFENGLGNWTTIDADGDGNNWFLLSELTTLYTYYSETPEWQHVGNDAMRSGSYINGAGALNADNWLITPQVTLGGMATFYARSIMANYPEQISVYVSTNSTNVEDFVLLNTWTPGAEWTQYMVDLSAYAGQGYIAIRNQGYDQYIVSIDDFVVEAPAQQNWIATLSTSENSITITGLQMSTTYAYQIQSVCNTGVWTAMDFFTTLGGNVFITDGDWNNDSNWSGGAVPQAGSDVIIKADATIPAGYTAIAEQITIDGGSITIADGGQLKHNTDDLEVTMKKNVTAYTGAKDNYKLLSFPFTNYPDVPESMMSTTGTDFYKFDNSAVDEEWQNNQVSAISYVYPGPGYLYANPEGLDLSMTGTTFSSYDDLYMTINYDENENGDNSGWRLIGNPFTCNAYIYDQDDNDMEVMFYDENGNMQTLVGGPVAPMQGFFVKVSDTTTVNFTTVEPGPGGANIDPGYNKSAISLDKKMHKTASQAVSFDKIEYKNVTVLDKKAEKPFIVLDKTMVKKLAKKDAYTRLKKEVKPFKPIKK